MMDLAARLAALARWLRERAWRRGLVFWCGAVATGAIVSALSLCSDRALHLYHEASGHSRLWPWLAPPCGLALAAWLTTRVFPGSQGSGIPQVIAALTLRTSGARDRLLSMRIAAGKFLLTILGLASGASLGREGPTVQIGASIMHSLGRVGRFSASDMDRGLILAGGAAGVAAAFNTPLAGVVFAIEELSRSFEDRTSGTIYSAVILAGITSVALLGDYTYFGTTSAQLLDARSWLAVPACGVLGGVAGGVFARLMIAGPKGLPDRLQRLRQQTPVGFAFACGLLIALIGWASGGTTFGTGYAEARALVQQDGYSSPLFAPWKALATLVTYVSGVPGGIFAPSLAVGAGIGGVLAAHFHEAAGGAVVVLTMAAYFAGVVQAPLTAFVIVGEMTNDRALTLPLMAAAMIGRGTSALVCRRGLYRELAAPFIVESALGDRPPAAGGR